MMAAWGRMMVAGTRMMAAGTRMMAAEAADGGSGCMMAARAT
jgi:hypothetical protein